MWHRPTAYCRGTCSPYNLPLDICALLAGMSVSRHNDAVIFLRSTHAELTKAGYADLDPHHELFLLYRPERADEDGTIPDVSILSPRHSPSRGRRSGVHGKYLTQHETAALSAMEVTRPYLQVGAAPLKVRQGASLTSKRVGVLVKGTKLRVLNSRIWRRDGTQRLCVGNAEPNAEPQFLPIGWVTAKPGFLSSTCENPGMTSIDHPQIEKPQLPKHWQDDMEC